MVAEAKIPRKPDVAEKVLVADLADTMAVHGYKVSTHIVKHDHERDETSLTVRFVKASGAEKQTVLKMAPKDGEGDGAEGDGS